MIAFSFSFINKPPQKPCPLDLPFLLSHTFMHLSFPSTDTGVLIHQFSDLFLVFPPLWTVPYLGHRRKLAAYSSLGSQLAFAGLEYLFPHLYMQNEVCGSLYLCFRHDLWMILSALLLITIENGRRDMYFGDSITYSKSEAPKIITSWMKSKQQ